jgi:hypothetical protein
MEKSCIGLGVNIIGSVWAPRPNRKCLDEHDKLKSKYELEKRTFSRINLVDIDIVSDDEEEEDEEEDEGQDDVVEMNEDYIRTNTISSLFSTFSSTSTLDTCGGGGKEPEGVDGFGLYVSTFFLFDDACEHAKHMLTPFERQLVLDALTKPNELRMIPPNTCSTAVLAFLPLIHETRRALFEQRIKVDEFWLERFRDGNRLYLESVAEESFLKMYGIMPTFDHFLSWRRRNIGGTVVSYFAEYRLGYFLSREEEQKVENIRFLCNDAMMLANDLASAKKDDVGWNYCSFKGVDGCVQELERVKCELKQEYETVQSSPRLAEWYRYTMEMFNGVELFHQNANRWHSV